MGPKGKDKGKKPARSSSSRRKVASSSKDGVDDAVKDEGDAKPRGQPKVAQSNRPHSSEREKTTSLKSDSEKDPADDAEEEEEDDDGDKMAESDGDSEADATKSGDMEVEGVVSVRGRPRLEKDRPGWWGFKPVDYEAWATALPIVRQRVLADGEGAYSRLRIDRGPDQEYILIQERSADGSDEVFETVLLTKNARSEIKFGPDGGLVISHRP